MDELSMMEVPEPSLASGGVFQLQQVALFRESLLRRTDWSAVAQFQREHVFVLADRDDPDLKKLAELYSDDLVENVLEPPQERGNM